MHHSPDFSAKHPVTPLRDCSPRIQAMFGYRPKRASATRDGPFRLYLALAYSRLLAVA
jgi:hypothetical protein